VNYRLYSTSSGLRRKGDMPSSGKSP
jgi:hypothetical protein